MTTDAQPAPLPSPQAPTARAERILAPDIARGLVLLEFLLETETHDGHLSVTPVGGRGRHDAVPAFDQQPIEALATVDACLAGWRATGATRYAHAARQTFEWFGGRNVHGVALARPSDGICFDGLTVDGLNRNHGAESILSYHLAAASVRRGLLGLSAPAG